MKNYALALFIIGVTAFGCQKDKDGDDSGKTKTELITSSSWKFDKAFLGSTSVPMPAGYLEACVTDNILTLKADGTGTVDEGPSRCEPSDPQTNNITWQFKDNETVLSSPGEIIPGVSGDITINILTSTKLQVQKAVPTQIGTQTVIIDLKH